MKVRTKIEARSQSRWVKLPKEAINEATLYVKTLSLDNELPEEVLTEEQRSNLWQRIKKLLKLK
jgi:hypothetical protein